MKKSNQFSSLILYAFVSAAIFAAILLFSVGSNPLWYLAAKHFHKATLVALKMGFDPNDCRKDCPLFTAALFQDQQMVKILIDHGASIHVKDKSNNNVLNASCTSVEMMNYFIEKGVDINNQALDRNGKPGMTPLFCAISNNSVDAVKFLLAKGADKSKSMAQWAGKTNVTPLQFAQSKHFADIVKLLQ